MYHKPSRLYSNCIWWWAFHERSIYCITNVHSVDWKKRPKKNWLEIHHFYTFFLIILNVTTFFCKKSYQWCFLVVMPNFVEHSSQFSPSPHFGSVLSESRSLKRSCLVATWQLKMDVPLWLRVPNLAPALTRDRHIAPFPFMYARRRAEK